MNTQTSPRRRPIGYSAAHVRVRGARGPARGFLCRCGQRAAQWAYMGAGVDELIDGAGLRYSANVSAYTALCRQCHAAVDRSRRAATREAERQACRLDRAECLGRERPP